MSSIQCSFHGTLKWTLFLIYCLTENRLKLSNHDNDCLQNCFPRCKMCAKIYGVFAWEMTQSRTVYCFTHLTSKSLMEQQITPLTIYHHHVPYVVQNMMVGYNSISIVVETTYIDHQHTNFPTQLNAHKPENMVLSKH